MNNFRLINDGQILQQTGYIEYIPDDLAHMNQFHISVSVLHLLEQNQQNTQPGR